MNALILVDLQNDFMPGGALEVPAGDEVVPVANRLLGSFDVVVATQDWHPADHGSFAANHPGRSPGDTIELEGLPQVLWPIHCVQGTYGAAIVSGLDQGLVRRVFPKGTDPLFDSYSGFFDNGHRKSTGLGEFLKGEQVSQCFVLGLATDYCVRFTALDALRLGFQSFLVLDGCRGVELRARDIDKAIEELARAGTRIINSQWISEQRRA